MSDPIPFRRRRDRGPDLDLTADDLIAVLDVEDENQAPQAFVDALGTLAGLTDDDLVLLAVLLTRRLIAQRRRGR